MGEINYGKFRELLLKHHEELTSLVRHNEQNSLDEVKGDVPDVTDDAARTYSRQVMLHIGEQERTLLHLIEDALDRIENQEYGFCAECDEEIPEKRLELVPHSALCVGCQDKAEQSGGN